MDEQVSLNLAYEEKSEEAADFKNSIVEKPTKRTIILTMVLSFVIPVIIMVLAFLKVQVWPGGKYTILLYDMQAQFAPIYASLRYLGKSDNSLLYTFFGALGNNALPNYAAYILDPMSWLTVLFPLEQLPDVLYFITLIKFGLCGLGVSIFFLFGKKSKRNLSITVLLSCCYALMSYNVMYSEVLTWLNVVALTPIMLLGIERIIDEKKGSIYLISLFFSLVYCFQLAYIAGIFCIIYLIYRLPQISQNKKKIFVKFAICSLLSLGAYMPFFAPTVLGLMNGRMSSGINIEWNTYFNFWEIFKQFLSCQYDTINSGGLPSVFCGSITLVGVIIFALYIASFCIVPLDQVWHGFNRPIAFPARYSYTLCLFLIVLAYEGLSKFISKIYIPKEMSRIAFGVSLLVVGTELYFNSSYIIATNNIVHKYMSRMEYSGYGSQLTELVQITRGDDDFYRIGRDYSFSLNDGMLYGYNGIGYFSSNYNLGFMNFMGLLGYAQNVHTLRDYCATPVVESLLGGKYKITTKKNNLDYYSRLQENNSFVLSYNDDALPVGFVVSPQNDDDSDMQDLYPEMDDENTFAYQEFILSEMIGERAYIYNKINYNLDELEKINGYRRRIVIKFKAESNDPVWLYCKNPDIVKDEINKYYTPDSEEGEFFVNGTEVFPFRDTLSTTCVYLGRFEKGEDVEVYAACTLNFGDPYIVSYNENIGSEIFERMKHNSLDVTYHKNGVIRGNISVLSDNSALILTLPFMDGYQICVDGNEVEYGSYRDVFLAVKMQKGEHTVEISFVPPGLGIGGIIGIITFLIICIYLSIPPINIFAKMPKTEEITEQHTDN